MFSLLCNPLSGRRRSSKRNPKTVQKAPKGECHRSGEKRRLTCPLGTNTRIAKEQAHLTKRKSS